MANGWHWIKPNESCRTPTSLAFVGLSTHVSADRNRDGSRDEVMLVATLVTLRLEKGQVTRRDSKECWHPDQFWEELYNHSSDRRPTWIYAYDALHTFTLLRLWREIEEDRQWIMYKGDKGRSGKNAVAKGEKRRPGFMCIEDRPFIVELFHNGGRIRYLDVRNYGDVTTEQLVKVVSLADSCLGTAMVCHDWPRMASSERARSVELYVLQMMQWWRESDGGVWKSTIGGLAWNNYRHKHMRIGVCCHTDADALALEKASYYGGIVEARYRGKVVPPWDKGLSKPFAETQGISGPVYQVDVRSMYPSVMRQELFPRRLVLTRRFANWRSGLSELRTALHCYGAVATVLIESPEYPYPVNVDGRTRHAYGTFWTTLPGPELVSALGRGHVRECAELAVYSVGRIFASYSEYWIGQRNRYRDAGEAQRESFCKLMGNALYGRFAARKRFWRDRPDLMSDVMYGSWPERSLCVGHELDARKECTRCGRMGGYTNRDRVQSFRSVAGYVQELCNDALANGAFPSISAYVASYARLRVRRLLSICPSRSVLYVDTDGFLCTQDAIDALRSELHSVVDGPGSLRLVRAVADGEIIGCRAYRLGDEWLHAGLPDGALNVGCDHWQYESRESATEILKHQPGDSVKVRQREFVYDPGAANSEYTPDGWLIPLVLDAEEPPPF